MKSSLFRCILKRLVAIVLPFFSCVLMGNAEPSTIDKYSRSVVFLSDTIPILEEIDGRVFEVGLKIPNSNIFINKTKTITGSGFIVISHDIEYLVTARHVATNMTENCELVLGETNGTPIHLKLSSISLGGKFQWIHHTNADVSIHPLTPTSQDGISALTSRAVPLSMLDYQTNLPSRDTFLTVLGFPLRMGAEGEFSPLSRDSKRASGMLHGDSLFYLLQDPSVSGYSGGPVVESGETRIAAGQIITGGTRCWGFVSGTYSDETGGKMTKVIPSFYAVQMIRDFESTSAILKALVPPVKN